MEFRSTATEGSEMMETVIEVVDIYTENGEREMKEETAKKRETAQTPKYVNALYHEYARLSNWYTVSGTLEVSTTEQGKSLKTLHVKKANAASWTDIQ